MDVWRLPPILAIQLKRFQYTQYSRRKLRNLVHVRAAFLRLRGPLSVVDILGWPVHRSIYTQQYYVFQFSLVVGNIRRMGKGGGGGGVKSTRYRAPLTIS